MAAHIDLERAETARDPRGARSTVRDAPDERWVLPRFGGPDRLRREARPAPEPDPGELRIRVETAGLSPADLLMMRGVHPERRRPPFTPGWDVIGVVDRLGHGAPPGWLGRRVAALTVVGGLARYACVRVPHAVTVPEGLPAAEAQCLPFDGVVARQLIHRVARVGPGARLLVHGASGSIGGMLVALGRQAGWATTHGTASTSKLDRVRAAGAVPIDHRREDFARVLARREPGGLDAVFDGVGHTAWRSFGCLGPRGVLVANGHAPVIAGGRRDWRRLAETTLGIAAARFGSLASRRRVCLYGIQRMRRRHPGWYRDDLRWLFARLGAGALRPRVHRTVPFAQVPGALATLERGEATGKIVVDVAGHDLSTGAPAPW